MMRPVDLRCWIGKCLSKCQGFQNCNGSHCEVSTVEFSKSYKFLQYGRDIVAFFSCLKIDAMHIDTIIKRQAPKSSHQITWMPGWQIALEKITPRNLCPLRLLLFASIHHGYLRLMTPKPRRQSKNLSNL